MTRRTRTGTLSLLLRHLRSHTMAPLLVATLVCVAVFVVALTPRALSLLGTSELRHELASRPPLVGGFLASARLGTAHDQRDVPNAVEASITRVADRMPEPLSSLVTGHDWVLRSASRTAEPSRSTASTTRPSISLAVDPEWLTRVRFTEGAVPEPWPGSENDDIEPALRPPIQVALSSDVAATMHVQVGETLDYPLAPVLVTGIFKALDLGDPYWVFAADLLHAGQYAAGNQTLTRAAVYVDPLTMSGLPTEFESAELSAWYPIDTDAVDYAHADLLIEQVRSVTERGSSLPSGEPMVITSSLADTLDGVLARVYSVSALLALALSGPIGLLLAAVALGVQSVLKRRQPFLSLAFARGADTARLRGAMALEGLLLGVPAAVLAVGVAMLLLPATTTPDTLVGPALVALLVPLLFAALTRPSGHSTGRADSAVRSGSRVRIILEFATVALAAVSLLLVSRRGLSQPSGGAGSDPLLAAIPLLLALSAALVVLRLYPLPLRWLHHALRARRGAVALLGAARAVRDPGLGMVAALALVVGVSVAIFSGVMSTTVEAALEKAARAQIGADIRVEADVLSDDLVRTIAEQESVAGVTPVGVVNSVPIVTEDGSQLKATVLVVDAETLPTVWQGSPALTGSGSSLPMLVSPAFADRHGADAQSVAGADATVVGVAPSFERRGVARYWVVVDRAFAGHVTDEGPSASWLLVGLADGVDTVAVAPEIRQLVAEAQTSQTVTSVDVVDATAQLAASRQAPVVAGLEFALLSSAVAALLLSLLTVVASLVAAAPGRQHLLAVLRTFGLSRRQARALVLWEVGPPALTAIVAGTALGLGIPWIITATLDLRPFVGGSELIHPAIDPALVAGAVLVFAVAVPVSGAVATTVARHLNPHTILRMGAD